MGQYSSIVSVKRNELSANFDERHAVEDSEKWKEVLKKLIGKDEIASVFDVETGTDFLAIMRTELGCKSDGIDFAEGMLIIGSQHAVERGVEVGFQLGEAVNLPYPDNTFDAVISSRALWTLLYPDKAFQEWKRVLKPGGMVLSFTRTQGKKDEVNNSVCADETESRLPLRSVNEIEITQALMNSGFKSAEAILLPKDLISIEDIKPWFAIKGIK
ncbi:MAG: methyltransferase domain-containing protein [Peptococcaceae bacterium]|nr:methyltransferase domain-containing protein [Peptococcaceae bacterium]